MRGFVTSIVFLMGCATVPPPQVARVEHVDFEPGVFLLDYIGENVEIFARPQLTSDELEDELDHARRRERDELTVRFVMALLYEADDLEYEDELRDARRARRNAKRALRDLRRARGEMAATRDFVAVLLAWRGQEEDASELAAEFVEEHDDSTELLEFGWLVLGETSADVGDWDEAARGHRYILGQLEHPLYPFALMRTAHMHYERGRDDEAEDVLQQVVRLGCPEEVEPAVREVAEAAASELRVGMIDGRFEVCTGEEQVTEAGALDDERPPGYR